MYDSHYPNTTDDDDSDYEQAVGYFHDNSGSSQDYQYQDMESGAEDSQEEDALVPAYPSYDQEDSSDNAHNSGSYMLEGSSSNIEEASNNESHGHGFEEEHEEDAEGQWEDGYW